MHGELIYSTGDGGTDRRIRGNATPLDAQTLRWEIHDRDLSEEEIALIGVELEGLRDSGRTVSVQFVDPGPLLDEVESGPLIEIDESVPFTCRLVDVDSGKGVVRLERLPDPS